MKLKNLSMMVVVMATATTAHAARVTNLDSVPHIVTFAHAGDVVEQEVAPNRTVYFQRLDGVISLKGGKASDSTLNSGGGLLNGVIGAARTSNIPAGPADDFTIWPGGDLRLQRRVKGVLGN